MQKPILFVKNITLEGPGTIEQFLVDRNISFEIRDIYDGDKLPGNTSGYGAVVILGGPMNVSEEKKYPFLREEKQFLTSLIRENIPVLGVCLGAQLVAETLGGCVEKNELPEIGWMEVELTPEGEKNILFEDIANRIPVFQWHGDTFSIPPRCKWLVRSPLCQHQAFSYEDRIFGIQFHVEVDTKTAATWAHYYMKDLDEEERDTALALIDCPDIENEHEVRAVATNLFRNFFGKVAGYF